jgi:Homeodomain-like domain-containing protein
MFVHPVEARSCALALLAEGLNDCEVARRTGIPRSTIRDWRRPRYIPKTVTHGLRCPRCWQPAYRRIEFAEADYAELLGLYLGDGHIVRAGRTMRLRIFLDSRYPLIVRDVRDLLARSFPENGVGLTRLDGGSTSVVSLYSCHLPCLFPQHGPGKKHERRVRLEAWQERIVAAEPWPFLRGCIRSDGCVFVNRTGPYSYLSYEFANHSADIRELFTWACDLVDVRYRVNGTRVRIYQRASVNRLVRNVGRKS